MDLREFHTIEQWFLNISEGTVNVFPYDYDYVTRYKNYKNTLNEWIHPFVVGGSMIVDGGYLNDHGSNHINKVIYNASQLVKAHGCKLSEYETYILLMAIHLHDVGNIFGRNGHEMNSIIIMRKLGNEAGSDRIEWDYIFEIAEAHGGEQKDKITDLTTENLLNFSIRRGYLAAILKFADELSDDRTRANRFQLHLGTLPEESRIYHTYSYCLHSVVVDLPAKQVKVLFDVEEKDLIQNFLTKTKSKRIKTVKLIDIIYKRTFKMHTERMYCMRFLRPDIQIDKIRVSITITLDKVNPLNNRAIKKVISYDLGEVGYPDGGVDGIFSLVPDLKDNTGERIVEKLLNDQLQDVTATY